jgi:DNA repair exonuclease SbcCD ATPase subunit
LFGKLRGGGEGENGFSLFRPSVKEDAVALLLKKTGAEATDSERVVRLQQRLKGLLEEAALVEVELSRADGAIRGVPHYSVIEGRAHALGRLLSQEAQARQLRELAASQARTAKCPACGRVCDLEARKRMLRSVDGPAEALELQGHCPGCRRAFFPAA